MKKTLLLIIALFVAAPSVATDENRSIDVPVAVETIGLEKLPIVVEVPLKLTYTIASEEEPVRCWRDNQEKHLQVMQYALIVGIAFDAGPYGSYFGAAAVFADHAKCKIQKARAKRRAETE